MTTYKDDASVVHAVSYNAGKSEWFSSKVPIPAGWSTECDGEAVDQRDVYHMHCRPVTCLACLGAR